LRFRPKPFDDRTAGPALMLHSIHIAGYRSLLDLSLKLAPLTIVQGANGVGKSNLYKAA
jgi:predicted ATPase